MRKKFAMRLRRDVLRRGAVIYDERPVFTKRELAEECIRRKDRGFRFTAEYNGYTFYICGRDALEAYRIFSDVMDDEYE